MALIDTAHRFAKGKAHQSGTARPSWSNWSGCSDANPADVLFPTDENALRRQMAETKGQVRVRGTGHSFTDLCKTEDTLISLEQIQGDFLGHRTENGEDIVRLQAGASLNTLSKVLMKQGFGFKNLGDIDVQSLAGAAMTATHGTGQSFPCLAGEIRSIRMVTATGVVIEASTEKDPDVLDAARVSIGALGVLTQAEVAVRPAYKLHRRTRVRKLKELIAEAHDIWDANRNFEFFVLPFCDYGLELIHNETQAANMHTGDSDDEASLRQLRVMRNTTKRMPSVRRKLLNTFLGSVKAEERIGTSFELLASVRETLFNEMEYHMPVDTAMQALDEIVHVIERERPEVFFPIEVRKTAGDTGWISPFEGAPRVSIAVHAHQPDEYAWFYTLIEPILRKYGGRPHWGKLHSLGARELADLYPRFGEFQKLRAELDPKGRLINPHLGKLFDVTPA